MAVVCLVGLCRPAAATSRLVMSTIDGGGKRTSSANYRMDGSIGGIDGVSSAASPIVKVKNGYVGQFYEVTSMVVTASPATVSELGTSQLSATAVLDDWTILLVGGSNVYWGATSYPIASIDAGGLVTPAAVYTDTVGRVSGYFLGASNSTTLMVLDTNPDNFGMYGSDGIPDAWQVRYFGTNNPEGVATADADGTGQNNLFKYLAGLDPTNSASIFRFTAISGQGHDILASWTCVGGHNYVLQSTRGVAIGGYTNSFTDVSPTIVVPGVGESTTNYLDIGGATNSPAFFYRVRLGP